MHGVVSQRGRVRSFFCGTFAATALCPRVHGVSSTVVSSILSRYCPDTVRCSFLGTSEAYPPPACMGVSRPPSDFLGEWTSPARVHGGITPIHTVRADSMGPRPRAWGYHPCMGVPAPSFLRCRPVALLLPLAAEAVEKHGALLVPFWCPSPVRAYGGETPAALLPLSCRPSRACVPSAPENPPRCKAGVKHRRSPARP